MSSDAEKHLTNRLKRNSAVRTLISSRVYPVVAPSDASLPYLVYSRNSTEFINSSDGYTGSAIANITISSWASTYIGAKALADAVRAALDGWRDHGLSPKIDLASIVNESDAILSPEEGSEFPVAYGVMHTIELSFETN